MHRLAPRLSAGGAMEGKNKVLIIDSEPDFINAAREALETHFEVDIASTIRTGISLAVQKHPDAIVLGYLEPRGASFETHMELRNNTSTKDIPLLIVDVHPREHARKGWTRHEGLLMNAEDYTSRPVDSKEMVSALHKIIRRASGEPMGLVEASEQMEKTLERINRIEELLVG